MRRTIWGVACAAVAVVFAMLALVVVVSKIRVIVHDPVSFATMVLVAAVIGATACTREARRALS